MLFLKYFLFSFLTYIAVILSVYLVYFDTYLKNTIEEENKLSKLYFTNFVNTSEKYILNNQYFNLNKNIKTISNSNRFKTLNINYTKNIMTIESLIIHANKTLDLSWQLHDIVIDSKYGYLRQVNELIYEIIPGLNYDFKKPLVIKSQASNYKERLNITSQIEFILPSYSNENIKDNNTSMLISLIKKKANLTETNFVHNLFVNKVIAYSNITYSINNNLIYNKVYNQLLKILQFSIYTYIILIILFILFNYIMVQSTINRYLRLLKRYTGDILNNDFYKFDSETLIYKNIKDVSLDISSLSKKMASIINEINVNKNVMEIKISTDALTRLPTTKVFEQDMKTLFLSKTPSFVAKIKLECLNEFSSTHTEEQIDKLIMTFVNNIKLTIKNNDSSNEIKLYRIYGSEFVLLAQDFSFIEMNKFLESIANDNLKIKKQFDIISKIAHIVSIPFDHYSDTKKLLERINALYIKSVNIPKQISYYNEDDSKNKIKHSELEKVVSSIISNNAFTLSYKFDTHVYHDNSLLMQEVAPNLLNFDGTTIPIGTFISVAHEKNIALEFDKKLILKAFKHIEQSKLEHKLAINISIEAMCNNEFITWLESQLLFDYKEIVNQAVFSVTTFAAKNNFDSFVNFSNQIKRFDGQIILKRFNYNDLTIEQLEQLNLNYIRVHSDYTKNIDNHKTSILSNISNYCLDNNIIPLADVVTSDSDNEILKSLGFYGTSK